MLRGGRHGRGCAPLQRRAAQARTGRPFDPRQVPEVAAGALWHPSLDTGHGTTSFVANEINGRTGFSIAQATLTRQPAALTENGSVQYRYADAGDGNHDFLLSGNVAAGWTGETYLAMWVRMPEATPTSGTTTLFAHQIASDPNRRIVLINNGTAELWTLTMSPDGTSASAQTVSWSASSDYQAWHWLEIMFVPNVAASLAMDLALRTPASGGISIAQLNNPTAPIGLGNNATGGANQNQLDRALVVYCPGIPSLPNRDRLRRWRAPTAVA